MEKNKSIDGLVSRRSKKTTPSSKNPKSPKQPSITRNQKIAENPTTKTLFAQKKSSTKKKSAPIKEQDQLLVTPSKPAIPSEPETPSNNITENFLEPVKAFDFDETTGDLKESKNTNEKPKKEPKPKKEKKKAGKVRKALAIIALLIVLALIGGVTWLVLWGNDIIAKITGGQGNVLDLIFTSETYEPLKTDEKGRTNILAFGTSGYNMNGDEGNGVHDGAALTDSIMAISLNQDTGDIAMISLPRDLKASPTCTATGKINEVYWCNNMYGENEQAGAEALMTEVSNILGMNFQYYAHLNWGSLIQIVDILGGITVTLDENISDYYWTGAVYEAGIPYTLNGEQALGLARARHGTAGGDFSRGASQQKILIGIKDKLFEKQLTITDLMGLASTLGDNLRTNFSIDELKSFAHLTYNFDFESMRQISLLEPERLFTTGSINDISYVLPTAGVGNYGKIQQYVAKMTSSDPRLYENPTILILNGTEEEGLAATEQSSLEADGYINISIDNAPEGEYTEKYSIYEINSKPGTKLLLEKHYNTTVKSISELPENIPRDYDFIIILGNTTEQTDEVDETSEAN